MTLDQLEKQLDKTLESYQSETLFTVNTFDEPYYSEEAAKETIEQMGRQTFYALSEFKQHILKYLKDHERKD